MNTDTIKAIFNMMNLNQYLHNSNVYWIPYSYNKTSDIYYRYHIIIGATYIKYRRTHYHPKYLSLLLNRINKDILHD